MSNTSKPTWTVAGYHAVICIAADEINRKMKAIFQDPATTDDFPHTWKAEDAVAPGKKPKWRLNAEKLGAPGVGFVSAFVNGASLNTPVEKGVFEHKTINDEDEVVWEAIDLSGVVFSLDTTMSNVEHVATQAHLTLDGEFTVQSLYMDMQNPKLISQVDTSKALDYKAPDDTKRSVSQVLLDMCRSEQYKKSYVIGISRIPKPQATKGAFTPRSLRFSTYTGSVPHTLNWNMMVDKDNVNVPLPDKKDETLGKFTQNPLPSGKTGALIISYQKIIEQLVIPNAFTSLGITSANWKSEADNVRAVFTGNAVTLTDKTTYTGKFSSPEMAIFPDPANNRIQINFRMDEVQQMKVFYPPANEHSMPPPNWDYTPKAVGKPKYRIKWSGYLTFSLDTTGNLKATYSQDSRDKFSIEKTEDEDLWLRIIADIATLGLHELEYFLDESRFNSNIGNAMNDSGKNVIINLVDSAQLPGKQVFTYDGIDWINDGLRIGLKYK